ncbi:nitroreductase [Rhodoluna sp.]|uniref:nitroreductase n=1 Tax=Rhodoluna sp. TaxID=1969481 RepID=UPI0025EDDC67|nr:nitroreductase [Rhodoluna sp.]
MINTNDFSAFAASRRSTRDFLPTPVSAEIIQSILTDAMTAPSWSNTRPYKVAVATGPVRDRISADFLARWAALSKARQGGLVAKARLALTRYGLPTSNAIVSKPYIVELKPRSRKIGADLYGLLGVKRGDAAGRDAQWARNYEFFGAPVELFIFTHTSLGKYSASDAGLFMQNLMLSAKAHGLGTCAQGAVAIWQDAVAKEFEIPKGYKLLCGIALGYASDAVVNTFQAERLPISEITISPKTN